MTRYKVCQVSEIPVRGARKVRLGDLEIGLFRLTDGRVMAVENKCPHKGGPLSEGIVTGDSVICPLHSWRIGLVDGQAHAPDAGCVKKFPVQIEGEDVFLEFVGV